MLFSRTLLTNIRAFSTYSIYMRYGGMLHYSVAQNKMTGLISENLKWYCMNFIRITLSCVFMTGAFGNLGTAGCGNVITPKWSDRHFFLTAGLPSVGMRTSIHSSQTFFFTRVAVPVSRQMILSKTGRSICRYYNVSVTVTNRYPLLPGIQGCVRLIPILSI